MIKEEIKNRPQQWEDEAPAEPRFRRVQQSVSPGGRVLPGMPLEIDDPEDEESSRRGSSRRGGNRFDGPGFDEPRGPWWRPSSSMGRVFFGLALLIVLGGVGVSAYLLKNYLSRDARFRIAGAGNIEATGLSEVSRAELLPVFGEDIGRNIFYVPLTERRRQLEQIPWIEHATVMRILPDQIRVAVVERQPVAFARQGGQLGLVDADGVLLTMPAAMMAQRHYSFPVVTGIDPGDSPEARKARMAVYRRLLDELDSGGQKLSAQISEIDLTDAEDARVTMQDDTTLLHFGQERFLERYKRYKAQISQLRQQYPKLVAVDLRYEQEAVMEMATGAEQAVPEAGDAASSPAVAKEAAEAAPAASKNPAKHAAGAKAGVDSTSSSAKVKAPALTSKTAQAAPSPRRGAVTAKTATTKTAAAKEKIVKNNAAKMRAAREKKVKRAVAERAALKMKRQRTAPNLRPAATMAEGQ